MNILALSGSPRRASVNTAFLRAIAALAPPDMEVEVFDGIAQLPVFSPDLETQGRPAPVTDFADRIARCDGVIIACPEYVRGLPGGFKNGIDWLVSGEELITKPIALAHASHRGDDMLDALRLVLSTVSTRFSTELFLRIPVANVAPHDISAHLEPHRDEITAYLDTFATYCQDPAPQ
ncbi:NADPH-dependent FMN reductase [Celeribacter sp.]|uniref:NADPH-dependent FMN reductase n=1 Tax=Celeribacter sp. TaxID=1890673 RepID=UPI003A8D6EAF